ncbi:roadblock/LC7 domain-containing protein [Psychrobacter sp. 2Y5]|uniref:roadblock/LC7 domain-containing protein n=1 Tax=unclassified Psychrobacter TaxID=196806 RepID=UPI003F44ABD6
MVNENSQAKVALSRCIKDLCETNREIALVTLCTTDGFPISCFSVNELSNQADKFAAMSSTLSALSDSSASQMQQGQCEITIVEATSGNMLFVKTDYLSQPCVLTVVAQSKMTLAEARYKTKRLASEISTISE